MLAMSDKGSGVDSVESEKFIIPIKLESQSNLSEHWTKKASRKKKQWKLVQMVLNRTQVKPPCTVMLLRIAPRMLDEDDNLREAFKTIKDSIGDILIPGLKPGHADADPRIKWLYAQKKGIPKYYAVEIVLIPFKEEQ